MLTIRVRLKSNPYPVYLSQEEPTWLTPLKSYLKGHRCLIVTNPIVARFCLPPLKKGLTRLGVSSQVLLLPDGERFKTMATIMKAYRGLLRFHADRKTLLLLLGGGVTGDLGGFIAATFLRGVPFIQIPTTLVAQVDSSIGGKVGIDLPEGKNLVGAFQQPRAVFTHVSFLRTLPIRDLVGGLGEVIKYGVIQDPHLFDLIQRKGKAILRQEKELLYTIIRRSIQIKAKIVEGDEKEMSGLRMILNFGHTFGHALERLTHYRKFHHGEAIAIGMVIASQISQRLRFCSEKEAALLKESLQVVGLPTDIPEFPRRLWFSALEVDKKSRDGMIHFVFMKGIGEVMVRPISPQELVKLL